MFAPVTTWMTELLKKKFEVSDDDDSDEDQKDTTINKDTIRNKKTQVFYTSRTHSQITQVCAEIKKCNIQHLAVSVIGSRDHLCINEDVLNEKEFYIKNTRCKELIAKSPSGCKYYKKDSFITKRYEFFKKGEIKDIEDLVETGKGCNICPYFMAKEEYKEADIILLPYKYIFDEAASVNFDFKVSSLFFIHIFNVGTIHVCYKIANF